MKTFFLLIINIGCFVSNIISQNTWYVSTTGSDTNNGQTPGAAFATVNQAINLSASCGDTVYILGGTYHQKIYAGKNCGVNQRIVVIGDKTNRPLIIGDSVVANGNRCAIMIGSNSSGHIFQHLELTSPYPNSCRDTNMVIAGSGDNVDFIDIIVRNSGYDAIKTVAACSSWAYNWRIIDCKIYNSGLSCSGEPSALREQGDGIDFTGCHNCEVRNTIIENNNGYAMQIKLDAKNVRVDSCTIKGRYGFQIGLPGATAQCTPINADSVYIRHNIIYAVDSNEFIFKLSQVSHLEISNNTIIMDSITSFTACFVCFAGCGGGATWSDPVNWPKAPILVRNNIFANMSNVAFFAGPDTSIYDPFTLIGSQVTMDYNLFYDKNGSYITVPDDGDSSIIANPLWCDYSNNNLHLQTLSPCINKGDPSPGYNDPNATRNDIGARYYQGPCMSSIQQLMQDDFSYKIYPNPFSYSATLEFEAIKGENYSLVIYTVTGQPVQIIDDFTVGNVRIDRGNLSEGFYFFQLINDNSIIGNGKLVITNK